MALDELIEKTTIKFPRRVCAKELRDLFKFVVRMLERTEIRYNMDNHFIVGNRFEKKTDKVLVRTYSNKVSGGIYRSADIVGFKCLKKDMLDCRLGFYGIRFCTTPGYELSEIPASRLKLMGSVRAAVEKYFSVHP